MDDRRLILIIVIIVVFFVLLYFIYTRDAPRTTLPNAGDECIFDSDCAGSSTCERGICEAIPPTPPAPPALCELDGSRDSAWEAIADQTFEDEIPNYDDYPYMHGMSDGRILVLSSRASISSNGFLLMMNPDGTMDSGFNGGSPITGLSYPMGLDSNEDIYVASSTLPHTVTRYNGVTGAIDTSFGVSGTLQLSNQTWEYLAPTIVHASNGELYYIGRRSFDVSIVKFSMAGVIDTSFGVSGYLEFNQDPNTLTDLYSTPAYLTDDGTRLIVICSIDQPGNPMLIGFNYDGTLDTTYGSGGSIILPYISFCDPSPSGGAWLIQHARNGNAIFTCYVVYDNGCSSYGALVKTIDGVLDTTFGDNGMVVIDENMGVPGSIEILIRGIVVRSDGSMYLAIYNNPVFPRPPGIEFSAQLIALDSTGAFKEDFADNGVFNAAFGGNYVPPIGVVEHPDNSIIFVHRGGASNIYDSYKFLCV